MKKNEKINEINNKRQENLESYINEIETQIATGFKGLITEVNPITNKLFFGDAGTFDERDGIAVSIRLIGDKTEFSQWFGKPKLRGYEQSNIYLFKKRYGSLPKKDMEIECFIDENGFFKIKY